MVNEDPVDPAVILVQRVILGNKDLLDPVDLVVNEDLVDPVVILVQRVRKVILEIQDLNRLLKNIILK